MAKIIASNNHLESDMRALKQSRLKNWGYMLGLMFIGGFLHMTFLPLIGGIIAIALMLIPAKKVQTIEQNINILASGLAGEKQTLQIFKNLPDSYVVISDLEIEAEGKKSQLDHVIIGGNGIFVVETKNLNGLILGNADDHQLTQSKVGRGGTPYSKTFYNPIKQVSTHVFRLSRLLKENGLDEWIQGAVYFSNPECQVAIQQIASVPVFDFGDARGMLEFIVSYKGKRQISPTNQRAIEALLTKTIHNKVSA